MKRSSSPPRPPATSFTQASTSVSVRLGSTPPLSPSGEAKAAAAQLPDEESHLPEPKFFFEEDSSDDMPFPGPFAFDPMREFFLPKDANEAVDLPPLLLAAKTGDLATLDRLLGTKEFNVNQVDPDHGSALMVAIANNQFDAMTRLLEARADVNATSPKTGDTPLRAAACMGAVRFVAELMTRTGIQLDDPDEHGNSALHLAALNNHPDVVKCLLQAGSNPNFRHKRSGDTALHMAASQGHVEVVDVLTTSPNVNVEQTDDRGFTPLHRAVHKNQPEVVESLVAAKADMHRPNPETGRAPLAQAAVQGDLAVARALLKRANVVDHTHSSSSSAPDIVDVNRLDRDGNTALQLAVSRGHTEMVRFLLTAGAKVNIRHATSRNSPLLMAVESEDLAILKMLLEQPGIDLNFWNGEGNTAVHLAVLNKRADVLQCLLAAGANVNIANPVTSETALFLAFWNSSAEIAEMLLRQPGIDHGRMNEFGYAALHLAALNNEPEFVQCLLTAGADVNLPDLFNGKTALTFAILEGHSRIVAMLLGQRRIDLNRPDKHGCTALHYVVLANRLELVQPLLTAGADPFIQNPGTIESPLDMASRMGYVDLRNAMLPHRNDLFDAGPEALKVDSDWYEAL